MGNCRYWRNGDIEDVTTQRIHEYETIAGVAVTLPIPIENIVEQVLGLDFAWDVIEERTGEHILGGLDAVNKKFLLNETRANLFEKKPGLLRSTIGHEAGHWNIDIDRSKFGQPVLFDIKDSPVVFRHASKADKVIELLLARSFHDEFLPWNQHLEGAGIAGLGKRACAPTSSSSCNDNSYSVASLSKILRQSNVARIGHKVRGTL